VGTETFLLPVLWLSCIHQCRGRESHCHFFPISDIV